MVKNDNTVVWRLQCLESRVNTFNDKLDKILENDLPHVNQQVSSLKTRMNVLSVINIGALVVALLVSKLI